MQIYEKKATHNLPGRAVLQGALAQNRVGASAAPALSLSRAKAAQGAASVRRQTFRNVPERDDDQN